MVIIIPFKTRPRLETEKAVKVMRNWEAHLEGEEANWNNVFAREEKEEPLSQEEVNWLNNWLSEEK